MSGLLKEKTITKCQQISISELISLYDVDTVAMVKIDVERAEMDVLAGVTSETWPKIRQLVTEVHDSNGRLQKATSLLSNQAGFDHVVVDQTSLLKGSSLYTVYCRREPGALQPLN